MTTGTVPPISGPSETRPSRQASEYEGLIDRRLRQTQRQVKGVDLWAGLITLAAGSLAFLLVAALLDHWLIPGGLSFWGRLGLFALLVVGAGFYLAACVVPLIVRRVNPLFAAHSIEQTRPTLRNSLINFLYLRGEREVIEQDRLAAGIYQALERKAAHDLAHIPPDIAVDRSPLIRLGYVLAAIVGVCCLYLALSPKSPLASFRRILWPWADVRAPTRVTIEAVKPGDAVVYQGDMVAVSAEVDGLDDDEPVTLYYTTADGQSVDQAIPLIRPEGSSRHQCVLPPGRFGLQQDVEYRVVAGDCRTRRFKLDVQTALSILVDSVEYDYPDYTGIPVRADQRVADLKAIEGTRVTIRATANQEIGRAAVELDCDPRFALNMTIHGAYTATAQFTLMMDPGHPTRPQYESYQLRFTDPSGLASRRPIRHRIEVIPDFAPQIRFIDPPPAEVELPLNGVLELRIRAEDPDFALRRVALLAECGEERLPIPPLLDKPRPEPPHEGPLQSTYRFDPAKLGLKAGDRVIYWAEAEDNMVWDGDQGGIRRSSGAARPWPNRAQTPRRWITIVPPERQRPSRETPQRPRQSPGQASGEGPEKKPEQPPQHPQDGQQDQQSQPDRGRQQDGPSGQQPGEGEKPAKDQPNQPDQEASDQPQSADEGRGQQLGSAEGASPSQQSGEGTGQEGSGEQAAGQPQDGQKGAGSETAAGSDPKTSAESAQRSDRPPGAQSGQKARPRREPIDGQTNPGDAFEEILRHLDEQQHSQGASEQAAQPQTEQGQTSPDPKQAGRSSGDVPSAGDQQPPGAQGRSPTSQQPPQAGTDSSGSKQGDEQRMPDNDPAGSQSRTDQPPGDGQGAQAKGPGEPTREDSSGPKPERPDARGGDPSDSKGQGGAGKPSNDPAGSPSPQEANQQRKKHLGEGDRSKPSEGDSPQSPTTSPKDSDSQGDTSGDRSGGGEQGGGQRSKQSGTGSAGTQTASEQGGSQSDQQGQGPTGSGAGDQVRADRPTGQSAEQGQGSGSSQRKQPGAERPGQMPQDQQAGPPSGGQSESKQPAGNQTGQPGPGQGGRYSSGLPGIAPRPEADRPDSPPPKPATFRPEDPNLEYAGKRVNLALEYLEDQLAKGEPDQQLLERLGWTKEDLRRFYQDWDRMWDQAAQSGSPGDAARQELEKAIESLGLRPRGTQFRGGRTQTDQLGNLKEGFRIDPPPEWSEAFQAYQTGVSTSNESSGASSGR